MENQSQKNKLELTFIREVRVLESRELHIQRILDLDFEYSLDTCSNSFFDTRTRLILEIAARYITSNY